MEFSRSADLPPVDLLLAHHADVNLKDKDGKTALDLAYKSDPGITPRQVFERHEVIRLLKAAEAKR
jgi:ankyrin repeat protein